MTLTELLKELTEVSALQAHVITALHVERWPIGIVAQRNKCSISRIQSEEAAGFRNMVAILMGSDGFDAAHAKHLKWIKDQEKKSEKSLTAAQKKAIGSKQKR